MTRKYKGASKSILHVKNSKSKSYKHKKQGRLGKDCIYYNKEKQTCNNRMNLMYNIFCKSDNCKYYKKKKSKKENDVFAPLPIQAGTHERTNEYIAVSRNIGTPCHVGYMKSNEPRRHKARCIYYDKSDKLCHCGKSGCYMMRCGGSAHCTGYREY